MALRRTPRRRDAQLAFDALSIEGGLLSPDWLARVAQLSAGQQSESDYRIPKGLNIRDEIGRYWRMAQAHWREFAEGLERLEAPARGTSGADARALAERFVLPFPIVRKNDEKAHGEYRTRRIILDIYDAMADAARTGRAYETRLDPPPADPRVAHPDTRGTR